MYYFIIRKRKVSQIIQVKLLKFAHYIASNIETESDFFDHFYLSMDIVTMLSIRYLVAKQNARKSPKERQDFFDHDG